MSVVQITAQGPQSILCFYNAISGGRLATVNLRGAAIEACFTRDGRQVVVAFRVIQKFVTCCMLHITNASILEIDHQTDNTTVMLK